MYMYSSPLRIAQIQPTQKTGCAKLKRAYLEIVPRKKPIKNQEVLRELFVARSADPYRQFSMKSFAQKYGVKSSVLRTWAKDADLSKRIKERAKELLGGAEVVTQVFRSLARCALMGSYKHQRLLLEITGDYSPGVDMRVQIPIEKRFQELEKKSSADLRLITAGSQSKISEAL